MIALADLVVEDGKFRKHNTICYHGTMLVCDPEFEDLTEEEARELQEAIQDLKTRCEGV